MKPSNRLQSIQSLLALRGRVSVIELAEQYQVAPETIRRDLLKLEKSGLLQKIHGGAISTQRKMEQTLGIRSTQDIPQKHTLAEIAATLIPPGSTLFIDFGTTTNIFAEHIKHLSNLTVFTNSHLLASTLSENSSCEIYVLGGRYEDKIKANMGSMMVENINRFTADFAVIGVGAVDLNNGFSNQNIDEATVARTMIRRSRETIILIDPSKFNRKGVAHVADFNQVNYFVSSAKPDTELCKILELNGVILKV